MSVLSCVGTTGLMVLNLVISHLNSIKVFQFPHWVGQNWVFGENFCAIFIAKDRENILAGSSNRICVCSSALWISLSSSQTKIAEDQSVAEVCSWCLRRKAQSGINLDVWNERGMNVTLKLPLALLTPVGLDCTNLSKLILLFNYLEDSTGDVWLSTYFCRETWEWLQLRTAHSCKKSAPRLN